MRLGRALVAAAVVAILASTVVEAKWVEVRAPHFDVVSQTSERTAMRLAGDLELFHAFLAEMLGVPGGAAPLPTKLVVFANPGAFERAVSGTARTADWRIIGQFIAGNDENLMLMVLGATDDDTDVLYHEYVHYLVRSTSPVIPSWLNEGLAEFFSTFQVTRDEVVVGRSIRRHLQWLVDNPLIPTEQLMSISPRSDRDRVGTFYAQSWALVHYLLVSGLETRAQLVDFLERTRQGAEPARAFRLAFGMEPAQMDVAVHRYVTGGKFGFYRLPREAREAELEARTLDDAEVSFHLADLQMRRRPPDLEAARSALDEALAERSDFAVGVAASGRLAELEGDRAKASELLRRAVALEPTAAEPWYHHARLEMDQLPRGVRFTLSAEHAKRVEEVRASLHAAIQRKPDYGPAYALLGRTYLLEPEAATVGIAASTRAYSLMRYRFDVLQELAMLTSLAGGQGRAFQLLDGAFRQLTSESAADRARLDLARQELELAVAEANAGHVEAARERLEGLRQILGGGWPAELAARAEQLEQTLR